MLAQLTMIAALGCALPQEVGIEARFSIEPQEVEVGQPFRLTLRLEHPTAESVFDLKLNELQLDDSWVIFDKSRETAAGLPDRPGRSRTLWHWSLASLDPGPRRLLNELISLVDDERVASVDASETAVEVLSVLGEGEAAPRPLRGLPEGFGSLTTAEESLWQRAWPGLVAFLLLCAGLALWRRLTRRPIDQAQPALAPLAQLEVLRAEPAQELSAVRERHFALTRLVRRATDEQLGLERPGLTDEEWLAEVQGLLGRGAVDASDASAPHPLPPDLGAQLSEFLGAAQAIKYAKASSSGWALEETHAATRRILESLAQASRPRAKESA